MKVIILSDKKQSFDGKNYWLDKSSGYYRNSSVKPHSLHRQVWIYHNGYIAKGMTIDHIDRDKNNNQIENLRMVTYSENNKNVSKETQEKKIANANIQRPLTKAWHAYCYSSEFIGVFFLWYICSILYVGTIKM